MKLRLATRGSALALWQARHVADRIRALDEHVEAELVIVRTTGDRMVDVPLARIGDVGLFTKEIDRAVERGSVDAAVHSLKDLPTIDAPGLVVAAVLEREDPRDVLLVAPGGPGCLDELPAGARVGTSSLRRRALLLARRPDLKLLDLRGNLDTRLDRLARGDYDALVVALAGVRRLGREAGITEILEPPQWLPAPGQGALAVITREDHVGARALLARLDHAVTRARVGAERAWLRRLQGGCQIPAGALATVHNSVLTLEAFVGSTDGQRIMRGTIAGDPDHADRLGEELAARLEADGAGAIVEALRHVMNAELPAGSPP